MLKEMPQIIDSLNTSRLWDLTLFQLESDTLTFGIPGEAWCFECDTDFQVISKNSISLSIIYYEFILSIKDFLICNQFIIFIVGM